MKTTSKETNNENKKLSMNTMTVIGLILGLFLVFGNRYVISIPVPIYVVLIVVAVIMIVIGVTKKNNKKDK